MSTDTIKNTDLALTAFFYGYALGIETGSRYTSEDDVFDHGCRLVKGVSQLAPYKDIDGANGSLYAPQVAGIADVLRDWFILDGDDEGFLYAEKVGMLSEEDKERVVILRDICTAVEKVKAD